MSRLGWLALVVALAGCGKKTAVDEGAVTTEPAKAEAPAKAETAKAEAPPEVETAKPEAPAGIEAPDAVAKRYVELGAAGGDLDKARALVLPKCKGDKVWDVDAARMLGARLSADAVTAKVVESGADTALVEVTIQGKASSEKSETTAEVLGAKVNIEVGKLDIAGAAMTTTLTLSRTDEGWRIACP